MSVSAAVAHDLTTCPICLDTFHSPRSLPCVHSFCLKCIQDYCEAKSKCPQDDVPCPVCRKEFQIPSDGVTGLPRNFFIQGLIDGRQITTGLSGLQSGVPCEVCLEDKGGSGASNVPAATKYCVDCDQKLCEQCSRPHVRWRGGGHEVKALGPELEPELLKMRGSFCDKHKDKRVELYCFTCKENICLTCSAVKHSDHKRGEIAELATELKSQINSDKDQVASRISLIRRKIKQAQDEINKLLADIDKIGADIKAAGDEAKRMIDRQVRDRLNELESVKEKQVKIAAAVDDRLQLKLVAAESFHRYSSELADKGRPSDVTGSAAELHSRAGELLHVISTSYSAPHVTFAPPDCSETDFIGRVQAFKHKVGELIHAFPEDESVTGVTSMRDKVYLLRNKGIKDQVEEYDVTMFRLLGCITVPNARGYTDMASCEQFLCLYIGDHNAECIHRLDVQGIATNAATQWPVNDKPAGLSITPAHNVLVTCRVARKIKEFSSQGQLVREITLPDDVINPQHAVQLQNGQYVVSHGYIGDRAHRVLLVSADGQQIVHSHGSEEGSRTDQYDVPLHLAVDSNEYMFVVDVNNRRVTLLSPTFNYIRQVVSGDQFKWRPERMCLDVARRRLYVADKAFKDGRYVGRAVAFSV